LIDRSRKILDCTVKKGQARIVGRNRSFDERAVLDAAGRTFLAVGYEATSIDELVRATGLLRGSLYQAFGSKRGLFLAVLRQALTRPSDENGLDLVLVAAMELAPRDDEVRALVGEVIARTACPATMLGERLLSRAGLPPRRHEERA
jgi:AcrR family transcriptional regulator